MTATLDFQALVANLLTATNAFDADAAVALFAPDTVIDDPSTGSMASAACATMSSAFSSAIIR